MNLRNGFEAMMESIGQKHKDSPNLFKKLDWEKPLWINNNNDLKQKLNESDAAFAKRKQEYEKQRGEALRRQQFIQYLNQNISQFRDEFNDGSKLFKVPMIQGTIENAAWKIIENGFGTAATLDDGYYGKGVYLTTTFEYANTYSKDKVFVIALALPGNPFPIIEHPFKRDENGEVLSSIETGKKIPNPEGYFGRACNPGYQSHYTIVKPFYPIENESVDLSKRYRDELVIFQDAQALPLFLIYYDQNQDIKEFIINEDEKNIEKSGFSKKIIKIIKADQDDGFGLEIDFNPISKDRLLEIFSFASKSKLFIEIDENLIGRISNLGTEQEANELLNKILNLIN